MTSVLWLWECSCLALLQDYRRRHNLEPLVKPARKEDEFVEQQGRARATVRPVQLC